MIGTASPRFAPNANVQLVASFNSQQSRETVRQSAVRIAPVNRAMDSLMRGNRSDFLSR